MCETWSWMNNCSRCKIPMVLRRPGLSSSESLLRSSIRSISLVFMAVVLQLLADRWRGHSHFFSLWPQATSHAKGFKEAVASHDLLIAHSKEGCFVHKEGCVGATVTSEHPSPKLRDLDSGALFITLPLIYPRSLLTSTWAVRLHVLVLCSWMQAAECTA